MFVSCLSIIRLAVTDHTFADSFGVVFVCYMCAVLALRLLN